MRLIIVIRWVQLLHGAVSFFYLLASVFTPPGGVGLLVSFGFRFFTFAWVRYGRSKGGLVWVVRARLSLGFGAFFKMAPYPPVSGLGLKSLRHSLRSWFGAILNSAPYPPLTLPARHGQVRGQVPTVGWGSRSQIPKGSTKGLLPTKTSDLKECLAR
jgi:hypothetical protein